MLVARSARADDGVPKSRMLRECQSGREGGKKQGDVDASHIYVDVSMPYIEILSEDDGQLLRQVFFRSTFPYPSRPGLASCSKGGGYIKKRRWIKERGCEGTKRASALLKEWTGLASRDAAKTVVKNRKRQRAAHTTRRRNHIFECEKRPIGP